IMELASKKKIPISCLVLDQSFERVENGDIILQSGLVLISLSSLENMEIITEEGREFTEGEVIDIMTYAQESARLKELSFKDSLLPLSFSPASIPKTLKLRNVKVSSHRYGYSLNVLSGNWEIDDIDIIKELCSTTVNIRQRDSQLLQRST
ncbi:hypothetical protein, partial [Salmonella sp. s54395]|uniref:hypothetical protein n=1 Tax=Salmonella sp. s54395 TaxID=3159664 RepID=UPI0039802E24